MEMVSNVLSICYLLTFLTVGWLAVRRTLPDAAVTVALPLGCAFGISLLAALPALAALLLGFRLAAALVALVAVIALGVRLWRTGPHTPPPKDSEIGVFLVCTLPLLLITLWLLHTHILHSVDGSYHTGQSCYGDLALHLAYIKSMAVRGVFPPIDPMLAGAGAISYPFLCESVSAVFLLLGASLRTAYLLPLIAALISVYGMAWQLARRMLGSAAKACLGFWLFFMGSGFGFCYFLGSAEKFASIFTAFYNTPTNYTEENILWVNPVVDLLVPQRATLLGWSVLLPALYLLWRFCFEGERRLWLPLALLVLPLPLLQTHSALALVLICLVCGLYTLIYQPRTKANLLPWLWFALLCAAVWLPETLTTVVGHAVGGEKMMRLHFNWSNGNDDGSLKDNYFWFYIKNIGLVYLLLLPAFFHAKRPQRWFYGGGLAILVLAELVVFQTNLYDNNKLLYIWHFLGCMLVASLVWDAVQLLRSVPARVSVLTVLCFLGMFGSVLTLGRELLSDYGQWSADDIALAEYLDENTAPDALFLTSDSHLTPTVSLAGRQTLCGSDTFLYFHGLDYSRQRSAARNLYENPSEALLGEWGVDYAVFDAYAYGCYQADENWYSARYPVVYQNDSCRVYAVG